MLSNAAILKIVINLNNFKMHFKIETLTQNFLSHGMETVALAFGSVADKKKIMAHSLETNVPFLIADCEATGTSVENMHVNDVILGGFICNIRV